ncbi:SRPBCC family protein, partial [Wolbachia endosymbiont of Chironomus riparius]|uniref:SRPBCC family protein n=1 Tax=Wolbachia endosymbiont of Chironomus riparius TaxID=2883238 RepID=UPI00273A65A7
IVDLLGVFHGIKGQYTSEVTATPPDKTSTGLIVVKSSNGIFKHLYNQWQFIPISENKIVVKFYIEFKFKSDALSILLNSVYMYTQSKIIAAFKNRVQVCHEKKSS